MHGEKEKASGGGENAALEMI